MSHREAVAAGPSGDATESATIPVNTFGAIELIGNVPAKMLTLLSQVALSQADFTPYSHIKNRLNAIQGPEPAVRFERTGHIEAYVNQGLAPAGMVETGRQLGTGGRQVHAVRATERGRSEGVAIAGALLDLELDAPQNSFLTKVMGLPSRQPGVHNHRAMLYQKLMQGPRAIAELQSPTYNVPAVTRTVKELCALGVLQEDRVNRMFAVREATGRFHHRLRPETRAGIMAALALRHEGHDPVSGTAILERARRMHPGLAPAAIRRSFFLWASETDSNFIEELTPAAGKGRARLEYSIADDYRPYVGRWLQARELLAADTPEGADFRHEARQKAWEILEAPEAVAQLLKPQNDDMRVGGNRIDWLAHLPDLIPEEGISIQTLHKLVTEQAGKHISFGGFVLGLKKAASIEVAERRSNGPQDRGRPTRYVSIAREIFPFNWMDSARCDDEAVDIDQFFPPSLHGPSIAQAEAAKAICRDCPVRLPCLKEGLEQETPFGVRGGVWLENPAENTPALREEIAQLVASGQLIVKSRREF